MIIQKTMKGTVLNVALEGRLDTSTAPQLEEELKNDLLGIFNLEMDFSKLEYISSAGLRVLLWAKKQLYGKGKVTIRHPNEIVREVFSVTGFDDILQVEL
ncbi:MAG: STAS domain-containing protein [Solobacterium sp.]|nr:STAS domain-containing protein [Solobacterium sp.]